MYIILFFVELKIWEIMKNGWNMVGFKKKYNVKSFDRLFFVEIDDRVYIYIIIRSRLKLIVLNGNL